MSTTCDLTPGQIGHIAYALTRRHHPHRADDWIRWITTRGPRALHHRERLTRYWTTRITTDAAALQLACTTWEGYLASLPRAPRTPSEPAPSHGPGTELKRLLGKIGITASPTCTCTAHAREMDHRGADWCRENMETILGWLQEEAARRHLPFSRIAATLLLRAALRAARRHSTTPTTTP